MPPEGYPVGSVEVFAQLVTDPAEVTISESSTFDNDDDGEDDSIEVGYGVLSQAFYEKVSVVIEAVDEEGGVVSSSVNQMIVGNSVPVDSRFWFTPPYEGDWTFRLSLLDTKGIEIDQAIGFVNDLGNMKPTALGSSSTLDTQPWLQIAFFGSGVDDWGIGLNNGSYLSLIHI